MSGICDTCLTKTEFLHSVPLRQLPTIKLWSSSDAQKGTEILIKIPDPHI